MTPRKEWIAMLAKLTTPHDPVKAATAFAAFLPMLTDFPDQAFCKASLEHVASKATFAPNYGFVRGELGGWWRDNRPDRRRLEGVIMQLPGPQRPGAPSDAEKAAVTEIVKSWQRDVAKRSAASPQQPAAIRPSYLTPGQLRASYASTPDKMPPYLRITT